MTDLSNRAFKNTDDIVIGKIGYLFITHDDGNTIRYNIDDYDEIFKNNSMNSIFDLIDYIKSNHKKQSS